MREGWREVRLGEVLALDLDPVIVRPDVQYELAGVYSFGRGLFRRDPLPGAKTSYRQLHRLRKGQLVLSKLKAWEGAVAVVGEAFDGFVLSPEFPTFSITGALEPGYLSLHCGQASFWERLRLESRGVGGRRERVHPRRLLDVAIGLPPLAEQRRIADVAGAVDHVARLAATLAEDADGTRTAFEESKLPIIRPGATVPLGDIAEVVSGVTKDAKRQADPSFVEVPYVRVANVQRGYLDLDDVATIRVPERRALQLRLRTGDVLFNEGGDRNKLGRGWVWEGQIDRCIHQNHVLRARLRDEAFDPRFVSIWGNTYGRHWFEAMGSQTTNLASLNLSTLKRFPVPVLPVAEQRLLVESSEAFRSLARLATTVAEAASDLRLAVLADLLSGNHEIPDSYDAILESAS